MHEINKDSLENGKAEVFILEKGEKYFLHLSNIITMEIRCNNQSESVTVLVRDSTNSR